MSEMRQNIATKEWVIIASERARRPNMFAETRERTLTADRPAHDAACPFCPGNEEIDLEVDRWPLTGDWHTRIVRNKFPALTEAGAPLRSFDGVERRISGMGYHDVVIEHPRHNTTLALLPPADIVPVFKAFQRRGRYILSDPHIEQIIYFKNHGERAGASLAHPHSQIIALPVVPKNVRLRLEESRRFFEETGDCVVCAMLRDELARGVRLITESRHFVAFMLYAALSPFHLWIVPRRHCNEFLYTTGDEIEDLAMIVNDVLARIYTGLNDPDFNMIIRTAPTRETPNAHFHWYISLVLRVSRMAGFEMGSGMHINPCPPEECAAFLRTQTNHRTHDTG